MAVIIAAFVVLFLWDIGYIVIAYVFAVVVFGVEEVGYVDFGVLEGRLCWLDWPRLEAGALAE